MLLFDTGKKLEKAFTQEQFNALVEVLESREDKAATKEDLAALELRLTTASKKELAALELRVTAASKEGLSALELRLTADLQKHREETKAELQKHREETKAELTAMEGRFTTELQKHREETKAELTAMEARLRNEIEKQQLLLQRDIQKTKVETLQWTVGLMVAQTAAIIAAVGALIRFMR